MTRESPSSSSRTTREARPGEVVAIFGANGSGKTTFLKAIAGLEGISAGRITFRGEDIAFLPAHERVAGGYTTFPTTPASPFG